MKHTIITILLLALANVTHAIETTHAWNSHNAVLLHLDDVSTPGSDLGNISSQKGAKAWWEASSDGTTITLALKTDTLGIDLDEVYSWPAAGAGPYLLGADIDAPGVNRINADGWRFAWSGWPLVDERNLPDVPDGGSTLALLGVGLAGLAARRLRWLVGATIAVLHTLSASAIWLDVSKHDPQWLEFRLSDNDTTSPNVLYSSGGGSWAHFYLETWPVDSRNLYTTFLVQAEWDFAPITIFGDRQPDGTWALAYGDMEPVAVSGLDDRPKFLFEHPWQRVPDGGSTLALLGIGLFGLAARQIRGIAASILLLAGLNTQAVNTPETLSHQGREPFVAVVFDGTANQLSRHTGITAAEAREKAMIEWVARQREWEASRNTVQATDGKVDPPMWDLYRQRSGRTYVKDKKS